MHLFVRVTPVSFNSGRFCSIVHAPAVDNDLRAKLLEGSSQERLPPVPVQEPDADAVDDPVVEDTSLLWASVCKELTKPPPAKPPPSRLSAG